MKRRIYAVSLIIVFMGIIFQGFRVSCRRFLPEDRFSVLILYNPVLHKSQPGILNTYEKVLEEEGVPYKSVTPSVILSHSFENLMKAHPVIIIPDTIAQILQEDVRLWFINYVLNGGNVLVVYDVGIKNRKGTYLKDAAFSDLLGFSYMDYEQWKEKTYTRGFIKFKDSVSAEFFGIPRENLDKDNFICIYAEGKHDLHSKIGFTKRLESPVSRIGGIEEGRAGKVYAYVAIDEQEKIGEQEEYPAVVSTDYGKGEMVYVNLPLGYLSVYVDELPIRAVLKTFLFKIIEIPQLVLSLGNSP